MEIFKHILKALRRPKGVFLIFVHLAAVLFSALSISAISFDFENNSLLSVAIYAIFGLAGLFLGYAIYTIVIYATDIKDGITSILKGNQFTSHMLQSFGFRTVVSAAFSFTLGISYAIFNGVFGIVYSSLWYGALAAYYIMLVLSRGIILIYQKSKAGMVEVNKRLVEAKKYRSSGIFLLVLNLALSSAIAQMIFEDKSFNYPGWIIYAYAAYTFTKLTMSIINLIKSRRQNDLTIEAIRNIGLVEAVVSILALQTALLHTFSGEEVFISLFNTLTGSFVSLFTVTFSIYMIIKAQKNINNIIVKEQNGKQEI